MISAFPLTWPTGWKRTPPHIRERARFNKKESKSENFQTQAGNQVRRWKVTKDLSVNDAVSRVIAEVTKLGVMDRGDIVVSTNLKVRLDGLPYSNLAEPQDPGAAVYWRTGNSNKCIAVDRYDRVADNIAAIAATIEAMRAIERHGGAEILERVFLGFQALPSPAAEPWWAVLGFAQGENVTKEKAEENFRRLAMQHHPDKGGEAAKFAEISLAIAAARRLL